MKSFLALLATLISSTTCIAQAEPRVQVLANAQKLRISKNSPKKEPINQWTGYWEEFDYKKGVTIHLSMLRKIEVEWVSSPADCDLAATGSG
ncbi:MAG: hypothetical protein L3J39_02810 [Verrucomicrobiales bacterium]|nr:hypothetical protein [Verrucomicrobiales bacterium]